MSSRNETNASEEDLAPPVRGRRARLQDVARLAGVSLGSASMALSAPHKVAARTRERVAEAARELGYVPHGTARALASRQSMLVGVVLPTIDNPIFANFCQSLQKTLRERDYQLLVAAHEYDADDEARIVSRLAQQGIDGLVLVGTEHPPEVWRCIRDLALPCVCAWSVDSPANYPCVGIANRDAMRKITRHLLDLGHRRFAVIAGHAELNERTHMRLAGIRDELNAAGIVWPKSQIYCGDFSIGAGRDAMRRILAKRKCPTAVICATDLLAAGALAEARERGLQVPEAMSITGFDDVPLAALLDPPLTTIHVETSEIGRLAGQHMLTVLASDTDPALPLDHVEIPTSIVVRASTGAAPP